MFKPLNILFFFIVGFFPSHVLAQWDEEIFFAENKTYNDGIALVRIDNLNHFYNLEYYNPMAYSYTLAGYHIKPELVYHVSNSVRLSGGVYFNAILGRDNIKHLRPVYTFEYQPFKVLKIRFGTLNTGYQMTLPEQIYSYKEALEQYNQEGIQLTFDHDALHADVWLDWRYLSLPRDNQPERIFGGYNIAYTYNLSERSYAGIVTQMAAWHLGGQNLDIDRKLQTILNFTGGINYAYQFQNGLSLGLWQYFMHFENVIQQDVLPYKRGYGLATEAQLSWKFTALKAGYWYANRFYSPLGNHLFLCVSEKSNHIMHTKRQVIYGHIKAENEFYPGLSMGFRAGIYQGLDLHSTDFYLGFLMRFTQDFIIGKKHKQQ
ncbi:MAG: hypothetical protein PF590_03335 [Candidatus Delongbacteria bacterium]|jgi:hypothetical protein|nr:hypothetical protein [Candidatus Delongbacteria bacterium]